MPLLETVRAKAGAVLLDVFRPGWADEIDTETLDLASCEVCVLGQLFGDYEKGCTKLFGAAAQPAVAPESAGFSSGGIANYSRLTSAWKREIAKRVE